MVIFGGKLEIKFNKLGSFSLEDMDSCRRFFEDICTPKELKDLGDRLRVAELLHEGMTYEKITELTGMSSTTIARINRALNHGEGGYRKVLKKG